jgi:high-affinity Fe2+/Pb2+ permease
VNDETNRAELERRLKQAQFLINIGVAFLLVLFLAVMAVLLWQASTLGRENEALRMRAEENHGALCALRADIQTRLGSTEKFLDENPRGIPGISAAQIQQSIDNYNRTLIALSGLRCP